MRQQANLGWKIVISAVENFVALHDWYLHVIKDKTEKIPGFTRCVLRGLNAFLFMIFVH